MIAITATAIRAAAIDAATAKLRSRRAATHADTATAPTDTHAAASADACRGRSAASHVNATTAAGNAGNPLLGGTCTGQRHRRSECYGRGRTQNLQTVHYRLHL